MTVIINLNEYQKNMLEILSDNKTYININKDPLNMMTKPTHNLLTRWKKKGYIDQSTYNKLNVTDKININISIYYRYMDDILLVAPDNQIDTILDKFNSYHDRLKFTVEHEENNSINFLDVKVITNNGRIKFDEALIKRLGPNAHAFTIEIPSIAPPSVQLVPAKEYNGPPIGNSYDVRVYVAERADERLHRKTTVKMGIRVIQRATKPPLPSTTMYSVPLSREPSTSLRIQGSKTRVALAENEIIEDDENVGPHAAVEKPFLLSDGRVRLEAGLDHAIYEHGDLINVHVNVSNNSNKSIRRIKIIVVQHVDVCMFSNGKFKNVVALVSSQEDCPRGPGGNLRKIYTLRLVKGTTKNWIALEDSYAKTGASLASTVTNPRNGPDDRNVYTIYVSYYVKVKLFISAMGGEVSLKLPFTLMHSDIDADLVGFPSPTRGVPKEFKKSTNEITEKSDSSSSHQNKENKLEAIKEQKESRVIDVDLIEHCEESDST
ncbi:Phosrestin-2 [Trachymyrmex zeteki]|uniref:Phosrestin-2 n=1 Tax=Mycetomoellerius zeteki TaxID=64791 RepID=A0A151XAT2_9HYME|nr:Phosrestin-2 [Trachymyrmex zeteki]